jgi:hypothetical protein
MSIIYLAEVQGYNAEQAMTETLRFCSGLGYYDETNPMNGIYYEPRIEQPGLLSYEMFNDLKVLGRATVGYGELSLINIDGGLDYLNAYAFDGRAIVIKAGDDQSPYSSFITVFSGIIAIISIEYSRVAFRIRDKTELLDRPVQTSIYAGNNSLPNGIEGDASLKGRPKPLVFGHVKNITPILVNSSRLIYQVSSASVSAIPKVYDKGVELTYGGTYSSQIDMETNAPSAGNYKVWLSGGMFRIGSSAAGSITCDVNSTYTFLSDILNTVLTSENGIDSSDIETNDFIGMSANGYEIDFYINEPITIADAVESVCSSVGVVWWFDNLGKFRTAQFDLDFTGSVATLTDIEIISIDRSASLIDSKPYNVWKVNLGYEKNWTIQSPDQLASSVTEERKAWLGAEYRYIVSEYPSVKTLSLLAQDITLDSLISTSTDALLHIQTLEIIWQDKTVIYDAVIRLDANLLSQIKLNSVINFNVDRFGGFIDAKVIGIKTDYQIQQLELKLLSYA